jgi:hypothetical protein
MEWERLCFELLGEFEIYLTKQFLHRLTFLYMLPSYYLSGITQSISKYYENLSS